MRKISIQTWNTFQAINIFVNDFLAENIQVEIILRTDQSDNMNTGQIDNSNTSSQPNGCSISSPAARNPRQMKEAIPTTGIVLQPHWSMSWKGRRKRYIQTVLQGSSDIAYREGQSTHCLYTRGGSVESIRVVSHTSEATIPDMNRVYAIHTTHKHHFYQNNI